MKTVSYADLKLIPQLAHLSHFDFMHPDNDSLVNEYLWLMGFNIHAGIEYRICHHRRLTGEAIVGLQIAGEIRTDREFLSSPWCTAEDRMVACGITDRSLGDDLARAMNTQVEYGGAFSLEDEEHKELWMTEAEIEKIEDEMEALMPLLHSIRGDQHRRDGSLKRPRDYHEQEAFEKVRRKKRNRTTLKHRYTESA